MKVQDLKLHRRLSNFLHTAPEAGPRVLVLDIETFPMLSYHWRMWKQNISTVMNLEDITLMSFAVKWLNQPDAYYADNRGMSKHPGGMRNDHAMLILLHALLSNCDMIIAQNGKRFDLPQIKGRMAIIGLEPLPPIKVIDTMIHNKNEFSFSSNSLAHLTPKFANEAKTEHQNFPGFRLWLECLKDNIKAWRECKLYNLTDITSLEEMYLKLRGWYTGHHNFGPYLESGEQVCPNCGSDNLHERGTRKTQVGIYKRYQCRGCGAWSRGRLQSVGNKERKHILVN